MAIALRLRTVSLSFFNQPVGETHYHVGMEMSNRVEVRRARLLAAARSEFATYGMGSARVDRIAQQAGVNKERIYGYFGSKEDLFAAVIAEALVEHAVEVGLPSDDLGEYAGRVYDFHRQNPELTRLLMWEALHYGDASLPDEKRRAGHYARKATVLAETIGAPLEGRGARQLSWPSSASPSGLSRSPR